MKIQYVLRYFKDVGGMPSYFCKMTPLGPNFTSNLAKAVRFESKLEAELSEGHKFSMAPTTVEELPDAN